MKHLNGTAGLIATEYLLGNLVAVVPYETIGGINDGLGGTIVLLQLEESGALVCFLEMKYVADFCSTEAVYALCVVAHHAYVLSLPCELQYYLMLRIVGVLILVHQDVMIEILILLAHLRMVVEEQPRLQQEVVEVHGIGLSEPLLILLIYI